MATIVTIKIFSMLSVVAIALTVINLLTTLIIDSLTRQTRHILYVISAFFDFMNITQQVVIVANKPTILGEELPKMNPIQFQYGNYVIEVTSDMLNDDSMKVIRDEYNEIMDIHYGLTGLHMPWTYINLSKKLSDRTACLLNKINIKTVSN